MFLMQKNFKLMQGGVHQVLWNQRPECGSSFCFSQFSNYQYIFKVIHSKNWKRQLNFNPCSRTIIWLFNSFSFRPLFSLASFFVEVFTSEDLKTMTTDFLCLPIFNFQFSIMLLSIVLFCILFLVAGVTWVIMVTRPRFPLAITVISNTWWNTS